MSVILIVLHLFLESLQIVRPENSNFPEIFKNLSPVLDSAVRKYKFI